MTTTDWIVNGVLVLLVLLQIRARRLGLQSLLLPIVLVAAAAAYYLKSVPTAGRDLTLEVVLVAAGATLGALCGAATAVWRGDDGTAWSKAGLVAAVLWVVGVGSRLAFELYSTHGGAPHIARFSVQHHITSGAAWVAALVLMALAEVLARTAVLRIKRRSVLAGAGAGRAATRAA